MPSIQIPKSEMQDLIYTTVVRTRIIDHRRWAVTYEVIFERDGKLYRSTYDRGATEYQNEEPYEYDNDPVECKEVRKIPTVDYEVI